MNARGMEMAIQIFIVLFVLLAVSMLVLQLVSEQFSERTGDLDDEMKKHNFERKLTDAKNECNKLCAGTSMEDHVKFCIKNFDLTPGGTISFNEKENIMPGFGVCTDKVYCAQLVPDCTLGEAKLNMKSCKEVICSYWKEIGIEEPNLSKKLTEFVEPGKCFGKLSEKEKEEHWFKVVFNSNPEDLGCS